MRRSLIMTLIKRLTFQQVAGDLNTRRLSNTGPLLPFSRPGQLIHHTFSRLRRGRQDRVNTLTGYVVTAFALSRPFADLYHG